MKTKIFLIIYLTLFCFNLKSQPIGYLHGRSIIINSALVTGTNNLIDFPILLHFTDSNIRSISNGGYVQNINGYDIVFTSDGCVSSLHHQVEKYNPVTGELVCWVKLPVLNYNINTIINMYYGNSSIVTATSSSLTWSNDYSAVLHLNEDPTNSSPQMIDGSINSNSGSCFGSMTSTNSVTGKIGSSIAFNEIDDGITIADFDYSQSFTISFWFNLNEVNGNSFQYLYSHGNYGTSNSTNIYFGEDFLAYTPDRKMLKTIFQDTNDATNTSGHDVGTGYVDSNWHYYTFVVGNIGGATVYIDGVQSAYVGFQGGDSYNPATDIYIGSRSDLNSTRFYGGKLDEIRILNVPRSSDWIITEYTNQNNPKANITIGSHLNAGVLCTILPIELLLFKGKNEETKNKIEWSTATEINNDYFIIERSLNAIDFEPLLRIDGAGNSLKLINYECFDDLPFPGLTYYRLKQTDFNGNLSYSFIIGVENNFEVDSSMSVYPNPCNDYIIFNISEKDIIASSRIIIYNSCYQMIKSFFIKNQLEFINVSDLKPGIYILEFSNQKKINRFKLIKN